MTAGETHGLGYERVDEDPNLQVLFATMDATAQWEAIRRLREWERAQLGLRQGCRLLDVGCGLGDAALTLAADLGAEGEVVGIDSSRAMIAGARSRARSARCGTRFVVGEACALGEADAFFDAARSERTLQWLAEPERAVSEMIRVVRPGGLISLIDTDWSTFAIDIGDDDLSHRVIRSMAIERSRPSNIGGRLTTLVEDLELTVVGRTTATQQWSSWDPDEAPAPAGCFSMSSLAADLVDGGYLDAADHQRFVSTVHEAARAGRFRMALTMFAVVCSAVPVGT